MPEPITRSDEDLVEVARKAPDGDFRAFEALVQRHEKRVFANCRYLTRSADEAEDLAQEVFIKAYYGLARFAGRSTFGTWIQRIKVNHCLNHIKRRGGVVHQNIDDLAEGQADELITRPTAEMAVTEADVRSRIDHILDTMNDTLRIPLIMRDMDGLSYQEIADLLDAGLSAVKMRIKRAREEFRRQFEAGAVRGEAEASREP